MNEASDKRPAGKTMRILEVVDSVRVTPHMQRITVGGAALRDFPIGQQGKHIKLFLPRLGRIFVPPTQGTDGPIWTEAAQRPVTRTYTVRRHDAAAGLLEIDFVRHATEGPASYWAVNAKAGDLLGLAGPAGPALYVRDADFYLLAGDLSALPLISAVLETLPSTAHGMALIEIPTQEDKQSLHFEADIALNWLVGRQGQQLEHAVRQLPWPSGTVSVTLAGESASVVAIRNYLRNERHLPRHQIYAVPYWKTEQSEEGYHQERHRIMDEDPILLCP